jgi:hypothetical protein
MAMDKINGSPLPRPGFLDNARPSDRTVGSTATEAKAAQDALGTGVPAASSGDTAQISDRAHRLMELRLAVDTGRAALDVLPEVRQDKVAQARERLQSGFYDSREVREAAADGIDRVIRGIDSL